MTLSHLLTPIQASSGFETIQRLMTTGRLGTARSVTVSDLPASARGALIAATVLTSREPILIVVPRADRADTLATELREYLPVERPAHVWPTPEGLPYEQLPIDRDASTARVSLLNDLLRWGDNGQDPPIVIATPRGLSHLVFSPDELREHSRVLRPSDRLNPDGFMRWAIQTGYEPTPLVQEPGTIARRGGIIDLFPTGAERPLRLDLFGDEIDSIRMFDPSSQRSDERFLEALLLPPSELPLWHLSEAATRLRELDVSTLRDEVRDEWRRMVDRVESGGAPSSLDLFAPYLLTEPASLMTYFPPNSRVILDEPTAIDLAADTLSAQARELEAGFVANGELPPGLHQPFLDWSTVRSQMSRRPSVSLGLTTARSRRTVVDLHEIRNAPIYAGRLADLIDDVCQRLEQGWSVVIATDQVDRLIELFEEQGVHAQRRDDSDGRAIVQQATGRGFLEIRHSDLNGGWMLESDDQRLLLLTDVELFGFRKGVRRGIRRVTSDAGSFAASLTPGEHVVHVDHGIARFESLVRMDTSGVEREYMLLEYAKGDRLYVPVDQSDRVSRYSGGGFDPQVTKLGSGEWVRTKQRVRRAIREMAFELIQLYAERETATGEHLGPDTTWDIELAESFPFVETPDQRSAIEDVKADLETDQPMDRLICGDVGFGKTEVALRAAFKAVNAGRQVAILVPTTVLALQHFETFRQRLASYPVRVEMLSRLRNRNQQRDTLQGLRDGTVDIVIGTHRLVQNDVSFKRLSLVVIDEEQRFGVRQKEFLKQLRTEVDVLTMSATPIPRTLHMALSGIRDISTIDTAPRARLPIRTFVTPFSDQTVREVILRELDRGGQVYFVHNRVFDIDQLAAKLRRLVPEARFGIGHGQMDESVLEEIILGFVRHDYDVLISTTIIESGIDIPNVNTILIDNADTFGLTQLYQLRGRVGRGVNRAYAYLLYRPGKVLTAEASERLEAIQEATELGAGLRVAMRDLEIRGAGNILGADQSGHIAAIGFDLYLRLLSQAVEEIRDGHPVRDGKAVTLDLPLTALLPDDYIRDTELRLAMYRRVAGVGTITDLDEMRLELIDRFGPIPDEVEHLLALIALRIRCEQLGIESVVEREREIVIRPVTTRLMNRDRLTRLLGVALKLTPNSIRIRLPDLVIPWREALDAVLTEIEAARSKLDTVTPELSAPPPAQPAARSTRSLQHVAATPGGSRLSRRLAEITGDN